MAGFEALVAGIGASAALTGTAANIAATSNLNSKNRRWQEQMWERANTYNTPLAQKERLEAAGINPYSVLAQSGADTGQTSQSPTPQTYDYKNVDLGGEAFMNGLVSSANYRGVSLDNDLKVVNLEFARTKAINEVWSAIADWKLKLQQAKEHHANTDYIEERLRILQSQADSLISQSESEAAISKAEAGWRNQSLMDAHLNSVVHRMLEQSGIEVNNANKASLYQGIQESYSRISLMASERALNYEQVKTEIQKQATEICNRVLGREANKRAWNDLYINIHNTLFDMWNTGRTMKLPFGEWRPALPGATKDLFEHMHTPYDFPK